VQTEGEKVFVYGTLRRGQTLHRHIEEAGLELIGEGRIRGRLYDLGEYPGAVPADSAADEIHGEVYLATDPAEQLRKLDEVEEYDRTSPEQSLFVRRETDVRLPDGKTVVAWVYFLPREPANAERIHEGDYFRRVRRPRET